MTPDELRRFLEAEYGLRPKAAPMPVGALRADARLSACELLAILWVYGMGNDPAITRAHTMGGELAKLAAQIGLPMSRGERTYADLLRGAADLLTECGFIEAQRTVESESESKIPSGSQIAAVR